MRIARSNREDIASLKSKLNNAFDMKDLGEANHILGMRIVRNKEKKVLFLSHSNYFGKVFMRFNMEGGKVQSTPLTSYVKLNLSDCPTSNAKWVDMAKVPYPSIVGSLMYAMICTRLDIAHALGMVSTYMSNCGKKHKEAMKGIMRYLSGTQDMCICFGKRDPSVEGYTNTDYAGDLDRRRSTSGYIFMFAGGVVSWRSCLQSCTSMSTIEAEYILERQRHARKLYGLLG